MFHETFIEWPNVPGAAVFGRNWVNRLNVPVVGKHSGGSSLVGRDCRATWPLMKSSSRPGIIKEIL
jgi:hypothetical protein